MRTLPGGTVLILCTGNVCRSPLMERHLRHALAGTDVRVSSAGTGALAGNAIDVGSVRLLDAAGVDSADFTARQVTRELLDEADLVIAASREHIGQAAQLAPSVLRKGFAWLDLGDLLDGVSTGDIASWPAGTRAAQVAAEAMARRAEVSPRTDEEATVVDPFGQDQRVFSSMEQQVLRALPVIVGALRG